MDAAVAGVAAASVGEGGLDSFEELKASFSGLPISCRGFFFTFGLPFSGLPISSRPFFVQFGRSFSGVPISGLPFSAPPF